jgi:hypothetical protein
MTFVRIATTIFLELCVGLFIGLLIKDGKQEETIQEIKISTLLFIVVIITWYFGSKIHIIETVYEVSYLWVALVFGVFVGDYLKGRFFEKIVFVLKKKDVQLAITEFEIVANQVAIMDNLSSQEKMYAKLDEINELIIGLEAYKKYQTEQWMEHLKEITLLCHEYAALSKSIGEKESDRELRDKLMETGEDLSEIVYHTLNHTERELNTIGLIINRGGHNAKRRRKKPKRKPKPERSSKDEQ